MLLGAIFTVALAVFTSIQHSNSITERNHDNAYFSRDTALIGYSSHCCDSLSLQGTDSSQQGTASLYLLKNTPSITKEESSSINEAITLDRSYKYKVFHLLSNSIISFSACVNGSRIVLFIVKGTHNFERWKGADRNCFEHKVILDEHCSGNYGSSQEINSTAFPGYQVSTEDWYYLIFENKVASSRVEFMINILQVLYVVPTGLVSNHCSILLGQGESCSMPINFSSNYSKALLKLDPKPGSAVDWGTNSVLIQVQCDVRVWPFSFILGAVGMALLIMGVVCAYIMYRRCGHNKTVNAEIEDSHLIASSWKGPYNKHRNYSTLPS